MSNRINQLIEELREQCIAERRPLAVFVADETGEGTEYESCILTPMHLQRPLKNDKITPLVSLLNKKFRIEFADEQTPEDIEGAIFEQLRDELNKNPKNLTSSSTTLQKREYLFTGYSLFFAVKTPWHINKYIRERKDCV